MLLACQGVSPWVGARLAHSCREMSLVSLVLRYTATAPFLHAVNRRMDEWVQLDQMDLSTVEVELPDPDPKRCVPWCSLWLCPHTYSR